ncbi:hypothetical protein PTKIN_Ptkin19aG0134400 [Pterospermum kingtungense]
MKGRKEETKVLIVRFEREDYPIIDFDKLYRAPRWARDDSEEKADGSAREADSDTSSNRYHVFQ